VRNGWYWRLWRQRHTGTSNWLDRIAWHDKLAILVYVNLRMLRLWFGFRCFRLWFGSTLIGIVSNLKRARFWFLGRHGITALRMVIVTILLLWFRGGLWFGFRTSLELGSNQLLVCTGSH
jgi:hypothetical protein